MVEPMNAIVRRPPAGIAPRSRSKSPTNGAIRRPGYYSGSRVISSNNLLPDAS